MKGKAAESFEELHIYQRARELTNLVYGLTRKGEFARDLGLCDQIRRACVSIMSNIAEGFERGSSSEFIQFLFIAKGSCGEVRAQLQIARDQDYILAQDYNKLRDLARRTSGMISNFIAYLQGSAYKGEKFSRPARRQGEQAEDRIKALREAQLVNIRAREEKERQEKEEKQKGNKKEP
ncbi:MAG TPA: four helix bundle protein [bacterium]|nr:four helix bundle protein [bacterium]